MIPMKQALLTGLLLIPTLIMARAEEPQVVASIKPIHALVAGVMQGIGEPALLIEGGASPHDYSLRPSEVQLINRAQVVFWVGPELESFLQRPLANARVRSVELLETPGLNRLSIREGGPWEAHEHHDAQGKGNHEEDHGHHAHDGYDAHIWLDPRNAMAMVRQISTVLSELDLAHQAEYEQNSAALTERLEVLDQELMAQLAPVKEVSYFVFHDAYQYFEQRYTLNAVGSIVASPEQLTSARRVQEIRNLIRSDQARCVFSEPQFEPALVATLVEGTEAQRGVLDPLGTDLVAGPEAYFQLLHNLATSLRTCLDVTP